MESDRIPLGCGELRPDYGHVWLSHTPTGFGPAVRTTETLVMSQYSSNDCAPAPLVYGRHGKVLPPLAASKVTSNFVWLIYKETQLCQHNVEPQTPRHVM